jgi:WD40 repeat protein
MMIVFRKQPIISGLTSGSPNKNDNDGRQVISALKDGTLKLWHLASGTCLLKF